MTSRGGVSGVVAAVAVVVLLILVVAVVFLSQVGTPSTQPTTSAVSTSANLLVFVQAYPQTPCAGQHYANSSLAVNWGNLNPGTEGIQYMCLENTGTTPVTLAVTSTLSSSIGRVTSPQAGTVLNGKGILQVELDLWVSPSAQLGQASTFTITVGAKS
ncbi:MAG: hypothetical protein JRN06_06255 [Nitrososphaerota archaeon]|nr:hypothetical protein [Nitrososphaerota archaeon]